MLHIILTDIGCAQYKAAVGGADPVPVAGNTVEIPNHDYTIKDDEDVYGDYDFEDESSTTVDPVSVESKEEVNVDDVTGVINTLIDVFNAK